MRLRSVILDTTVRLVFDAALVLSLYFLFAGHNQPGGGFVGGLIAAAAVALRYVTGGVDAVVEAVRVPPRLLFGLGLIVSGGTAFWPLVVGDAPLDQRAIEWSMPVIGDVKLTTATIFDIGVYLVVMGLVLTALTALGDRDPGNAASNTASTTASKPEAAS